MQRRTARLGGRRALCGSIGDFRLDLDSPLDAPVTAGAHIDVHLPSGLVRQYSVWHAEEDGSSVSIAVKREDAGRGGSCEMHALPVGTVLEVGGPRNNFPLAVADTDITLIAGGIGITPIYSMAAELARQGREFRLVYLVRERKDAALDAELRALGVGEAYTLHCSAEAGRFDVHGLLASLPAGGAIYVCGPESLLESVLRASAEVRACTVHIERFANAAAGSADDDAAFSITLARSGGTLTVAADRSILQVLQEAGHDVEYGCSEGLCGACVVDVLDGEVDHRDGIFTPEEQAENRFMCVCVSRARSKSLVLDI